MRRGRGGNYEEENRRDDEEEEGGNKGNNVQEYRAELQAALLISFF